MTKNSNGMSVKILDKEYLVACGDDEQAALQASAAYLDKKMREIRDSGKVIGTDRIAVMAALNITYELLQQQESGSESTTPAKSAQVTDRIRSLQSKIEDALYRSRQLEF